MQSETTAHPIIRTYKGRDKRAAEGAYRADARQAAVAGWVPVAHRWTESWDGHELAVVFEQRAADVLKAPALALGAAAAVGGATSVGSTAVAAVVAMDEDAPVEMDARPEVAGVAAVAAVADLDAPSAVEDAEPPEYAEPQVDAGAPLVHPPAPGSTTAAGAHARAVLQTMELHCGGEPLRLIRTGYPHVPDLPILERRRWVTDNADWARQALLQEPRGHRDMYGAVLLPPHEADADVAVLFMHNAGYSTMCGHGIIALATGLIEERLYPATEPRTVIRFETPAGIVTATAEVAIGAHGGPEVRVVRFQNVPSYRHAANFVLDLPGLPRHGEAVERGGIRVDLAYGGAYYGIVDAVELGMRVVPEQIDGLTRAGTAITEALRREHTPMHPTEPDLGSIYGTIIVDTNPSSSPDGRAAGATMRNVTVFAEGQVDRSPCGSGTSALLAHLYAQGRLAIGQSIVNAGITGEAFEGRVEAEATVGEHPAVITSVAGIGFVVGYGSYLIDDRDPLGDGFLLR